MDRDIVIVVPTENAAYQVLRALRQLDDEGSIELHAGAVISKDANGRLKVHDKRDENVGWGTLLGMSSGALIGLLGGPVGMMAGAAFGGGAGLAGDVAYTGFASDFVRQVGASLTPGTSAVIAHAFEDWTVPIDTAVSALGGTVLRQASIDVAEAQLKSEMKALKEEEAHIEKEIAKANADAKAKLQATRAEIKAKQVVARAKLQRRAKEMEDHLDAEIESIKEKLARSKAEAKARHQEHMDKLSRFAAAQKSAFQQLFQ